MALFIRLVSCVLIGFSQAAPANVFDGYVKCTDGSSPQKDASGHTLACTPGQQTYASCQPSYQCMTPLPGHPGVCCQMGYVAATGGPQTDIPTPVTDPPPPPPASPDTMPPPPPVDTTLGPQTPPPPSALPPNTDHPPTVAPTAGGGGEMTPPPPTDFTAPPSDTTIAAGGMATDMSTHDQGGAGAVETTYPTIPPSILETTTSIDSVAVVTDSSGMAMVSPNAVAENRKHGNGTHAGDTQKGRAAGQQKYSTPSSAGHTSGATKIIKSFNGATIVVKANGGTPAPKWKTTTGAPHAGTPTTGKPH